MLMVNKDEYITSLMLHKFANKIIGAELGVLQRAKRTCYCNWRLGL